MKKNLTLLLIISFVSFLFISCPDPNNNNNINSVPEYDLQVNWKTEVKVEGSYVNNVLHDNYLYGCESIVENEMYYFSLYKLNLINGSIEWRTDSIENNRLDSPVIANNIVYYPVNDDYIYCFNCENGNLITKLNIDNYEINNINWHTLSIVNSKYIIWGNGKKNEINDDGIVKVFIDEIDFSKEEQVIYPKLIWVGDKLGDNDENCTAKPLVVDDYIYFITNIDSTGDYSKVGKLNVATEQLKWITTIEGLNHPGYKPFCLDGDYLYIISNVLCCIDIRDGSFVWRYPFKYRKIDEHSLFGSNINNTDIIISDDKIYYCTTESERTRNYFPTSNIKCINAYKGSEPSYENLFCWGYLPYNSGSQSANPIIYHGKLYVNVYGDGLYVIDKITGTPIGRISSIVGTLCGDQLYVYNNNIICYDFNNGVNTIYSIKP